MSELRLTLTELGYRRRLSAGEGADLVAGLLGLVGEHPLREALWQSLISAQYRAGRQADALRSYDAVRSLLVETLGVEPSPELQELRRRVLDQDPALSAPAACGELAMLLWDVAGSTGLLVRQGRRGVALLDRVADMVKVVALGYGGRAATSQGEADGAVWLFEDVTDAVAAAIEVNSRMGDDRRPASDGLGVRSAIHLGEVTSTPDGVFGREVDRCAQLRAMVAAGEVVLSDAAASAVAAQLPASATLVDEGLVGLRRFSEPQRVWRLAHPALRRHRRPLLGTTTASAAVPAWRTSFIGRTAESASLAARLGAGRLVTVVGPAGVGKTRLAAAVASGAPVRWCFVDLTLATGAGEVDAVTADALGADRASDPRAAIESILSAAPTLIVFDNCEHVLDAAAAVVEHVLDRCDASWVLATSRAALRLPGEDVMVLAPLPAVPGGAATQLFLDRAVGACAELSPSVDVVDDIDAVVTLLDGVPLAIELAAARVVAFSVTEILALLQHDLAGLGDVHRRGPERHRTLQAAIEWSMRTLSEEERQLLCRLSMIPGSFPLNIALVVTDQGDNARRAVVAAMPALVERSLVVVSEHGTGSTRYRLLEMIRAVGQDALTVRERKEVLDRLLVHCVDELEQLEGHAVPQSGGGADVARNGALCSTVVEHALATDQIDLGLRLVHSLFVAWIGSTRRSTLDRWMNDLLARAQTPSRERGMVLRRRAIIAAEDLHDEARAEQLLDAAEADAIAVGDRQLLGRIMTTRGGRDFARGRVEGLDERLSKAIALLEDAGGDEFIVYALLELAELRRYSAQFEQAEQLFARAIAMNPNWYHRAQIEQELAWCALQAGQVESATARAATALDMAEREGDAELIAFAVEVAAYAALARGEVDLACELFTRMVGVSRDHELGSHLTLAFTGLAIASAIGGDLARARSCRAEIEAARDGQAEWAAERRLACALVTLADGDAGNAAVTAADIVADTELRSQPYGHIHALELLAASVAATDPRRARDLLAAALVERTATGAVAWPLDPYRHVALATIEGRAATSAPRTPA